MAIPMFPIRSWRILLLALASGFALEAAAQQSPSTLPPQVVTYDPALASSAQGEAEDDTGVTIRPDEGGTSIRRYGSGGRPSREVVNPPVLPEYSESPPADPQSVIPDSDPVRGDMVQPPMWTLWSW